MTAVASSPVSAYYGCLHKFRLNMRRYTPFTYIAYKTLVPSKDDDLVEIAGKISGFITLRFFVGLCVTYLSPICAIIPFIPFILDASWVSYHWIKGHRFEPIEQEEGANRRVLSLFGLIFGIVGIHYMQKRLPEM